MCALKLCANNKYTQLLLLLLLTEVFYALRDVLDVPLAIKQYAERFHLVLHLEEIQMEKDIKKYDLYGQTMKKDKTNKKLLVLQVSATFFYDQKNRCNWYNMQLCAICYIFLMPSRSFNTIWSYLRFIIFFPLSVLGSWRGREQAICAKRRSFECVLI